MQAPLNSLVIVGVGLIGGSIGLAAKRRGLARRVRGVGRDAGKLQQAIDLGAIDEFSLDLSEGIRDADLAIFCTPVNRIPEQIKVAGAHASRSTILTDAGSTKTDIVRAAESDLPRHVPFVGGHPLAGSERKGPEHADPNLFTGRWTVLTPTEQTPSAAVEVVQSFWQALGARVRIMAPGDHDQALALTSHLPHLVASVLAGILPDPLRDLTATGFRDTTRVAGGDPDVWTPIFQQNRDAVLAALAQFVDRLDQFRHALDANEPAVIDRLLAQGKRIRDALGS